VRVRRAFNLAFDFEWSNETLFYGQYRRTTSFFQNTELAATELPEGYERELLEKLREEFPDHVPASVLSEIFTNPTGGGPTNMRPNYRKALALLREAGWEIRGGKLTNITTGQPFEVNFLLQSPAMERVVLPYVQSLKRIGIDANTRVVDSAQYKERKDNFDFDIIVDNFGQSESPGNEQRNFWGSQAAETIGSDNTIGIRNPAVDRLIDLIIAAPDRPTLVAVTRAMDRVLLHNHYVVPHWYAPTERIAYWNKFAHPERLPKRAIGFIQVWWQTTQQALRQDAAR
jgi:microcin C transport system substrate-binding protein